MVNTVAWLPETLNSWANTPPSSVSEQDLLDEKWIMRVCHPWFKMYEMEKGEGDWNCTLVESSQQGFIDELNRIIPLCTTLVSVNELFLQYVKTPKLSDAIANTPEVVQTYVSNLEKIALDWVKKAIMNWEKFSPWFDEYPSVSRVICNNGVTPIIRLNTETKEVNTLMRMIESSYPGLLDEIWKYEGSRVITYWKFNSLKVKVVQPWMNFYLNIDLGEKIISMYVDNYETKEQGKWIRIPLSNWNEIKWQSIQSTYTERLKRSTSEQVSEIYERK